MKKLNIPSLIISLLFVSLISPILVAGYADVIGDNKLSRIVVGGIRSDADPKALKHPWWVKAPADAFIINVDSAANPHMKRDMTIPIDAKEDNGNNQPFFSEAEIASIYKSQVIEEVNFEHIGYGLRDTNIDVTKGLIGLLKSGGRFVYTSGWMGLEKIANIRGIVSPSFFDVTGANQSRSSSKSAVIEKLNSEEQALVSKIKESLNRYVTTLGNNRKLKQAYLDLEDELRPQITAIRKTLVNPKLIAEMAQDEEDPGLKSLLRLMRQEFQPGEAKHSIHKIQIDPIKHSAYFSSEKFFSNYQQLYANLGLENVKFYVEALKTDNLTYLLSFTVEGTKG